MAVSASISAQSFKPDVVSFSYFGETITHPGFRLGVDYSLKEYEKIKRSGKISYRSFLFTPSTGMFYHKGYQTSAFVLAEFSYKRMNENGRFFSVGIAPGYLRTFIPNSYAIKADGVIEKITTGNNYFLGDISLTFGKDLSINKDIPIAYYVKPQFLKAIPSASNATNYFALELGVQYKLE